MGRAIDMEKDIDTLKAKVEKLQNIVRGMANSVKEMEDKSSKTKHVDLVDDVKTKGKNVKKKTNNKTGSNSSKSSNAKNRDSKGKTDTDGDSSK